MSDRLTPEPSTQDTWRELRDERGRLYARLEPTALILEVRRNHETAYFDLREYVELLQGLATDMNLE